ncbi:MAG: PEP-CTERM sorting domain-containing protein [Armatimonadetes bacterium]|nr:PEP-CTERM sorting domain-containing protein [Armatimonadota bacterium]
MNTIRTIALISCVGLSAFVLADTKTYSAKIDPKATNWSGTINLPQFDPSLGELRSAVLCFSGNVSGTAQVENKQCQPVCVTTKLSAKVTAKDITGATVFSLVPSVTKSDKLYGYDGKTDYKGTSGKTYSNLSASTSGQKSIASKELGNYVGKGNVVFNINAVNQSAASGSCNLASNFQSLAGANICVTYCYNPVPEPTSMAGLAFGAIGLMRRRKRARG